MQSDRDVKMNPYCSCDQSTHLDIHECTCRYGNIEPRLHEFCDSSYTSLRSFYRGSQMDKLQYIQHKNVHTFIHPSLARSLYITGCGRKKWTPKFFRIKIPNGC